MHGADDENQPPLRNSTSRYHFERNCQAWTTPWLCREGAPTAPGAARPPGTALAKRKALAKPMPVSDFLDRWLPGCPALKKFCNV